MARSLSHIKKCMSPAEIAVCDSLVEVIIADIEKVKMASSSLKTIYMSFQPPAPERIEARRYVTIQVKRKSDAIVNWVNGTSDSRRPFPHIVGMCAKVDIS